MRVSLNWLKKFVPVDLSSGELAERLTMAGLEVTSVESFHGHLKNVVAGRVEKIELQPAIDSLVLCSVDVGGSLLRIACGAKNLREGDIVCVAKDGSLLPGGRLIKRGIVRGVISDGMLCSEEDLSLAQGKERGSGEWDKAFYQAKGIMTLPEHIRPGQNLGDYLGFNDYVLTLELTTNRPDCLSVLGIAREVAAILRAKVTMSEPFQIEEGDEIGKITSVTIADPYLCPRYSARVISGVAIGPSPFWMKVELEKAGLRPTNNVVDVTNYVLLELGQPLHAFDYDLLDRHRIVVRRARDGERLHTLDGVERSLDSEMLVIADATKSVALAGVMGGLETEVKPSTNNILLESAYFNPMSIRRTAKRLGLHTEASHRFERGQDPNGTIYPLNRAAQLIREIAGGKIARGIAEEYPAPLRPKEVILRPRRLSSVLGAEIDGGFACEALRRLGLEVIRETDSEIWVRMPTYRVDLTREIDLIEEVARIYGYDNIPSSMPMGRITPVEGEAGSAVEGKAKQFMVSCGLSEAINYSFISEKSLRCLGFEPEDKRGRAVKLANPLSQDTAVLRTSLLPGLLSNLGLNFSRGSYDVKLFELGRVFFPVQGQSLPEEGVYLACVLSGRRQGGLWDQPKVEVDFYDIKGLAEGLIEELRLVGWRFEMASVAWLHPHRSLAIFAKTVEIGYFGELAPKIGESLGLGRRVMAMELDLGLAAEIGVEMPGYEQLPKYPPLLRDLAIVVDYGAPAREMLKAIRLVGGESLKEASIFDVYKGDQLPRGKKSIAFSLTFRASDRTLTDEEVNLRVSKITEMLRERFGAQLRS